MLILSHWLLTNIPSWLATLIMILFFLFLTFLSFLSPSPFSPDVGLLWFHLSCLTCSCRLYKLTCLPSLWTPALVGRPNNTIIFCTNYLTPTTGSISQLFSPQTCMHMHMHMHTQTGNAAILQIQMQCRSIAYRTCIYLLASTVDACRVHAGSVKTDILTYILTCLYIHTCPHVRAILMVKSFSQIPTKKIVRMLAHTDRWIYEIFRSQVSDDQSWCMQESALQILLFSCSYPHNILYHIYIENDLWSFVHPYTWHIQHSSTISLWVNLVSHLKREWCAKVLYGVEVQVQGHCRGRECHEWLQLMLKAIKNYWTETSQPVLAL